MGKTEEVIVAVILGSLAVSLAVVLLVAGSVEESSESTLLRASEKINLV